MWLRGNGGGGGGAVAWWGGDDGDGYTVTAVANVGSGPTSSRQDTTKHHERRRDISRIQSRFVEGDVELGPRAKSERGI